MGKTAWTVACAIGAVVMLALAGVSAFVGGCSAMIECANGSVPMKCHWVFVADTFIGVVGAVVASVAMSCKDQSGRRASAVGYVATAIVAACMPSSLAIGVCADAAMHCHGTAAIVWALSAAAVVIGVVQIVKSNPEAATMPKRSL